MDWEGKVDRSDDRLKKLHLLELARLLLTMVPALPDLVVHGEKG